jgi:hypothetical protein
MHAGTAGQQRDRTASLVDRRHQCEPVLVAQMQVEEDDVDRLVGERSLRGADAFGLDDAVALELEVDATEEPERRIVVDDEHGRSILAHAPECIETPGRTRIRRTIV